VVGSDIHIHPHVLLLLIAPNIVLVRGKRSMFKVKTPLALIQSLFYPPQAIHIDGVDLLDDVLCLPKHLGELVLV
jgi:hypothetical protein